MLVAGADVDAVNLGVTTLARRIKPGIFVVIRQNHIQDRALINAAHANVTFVQSELMVHECLQLLKTPMLGRFISHLREAETNVAAAAIARVRDEVGAGAPAHGSSNAMFCSRACSALSSRARRQTSASPTCWPTRRTAGADAAAALTLERQGTFEPPPGPDLKLKPGDRILFVGDDVTRRRQRRYLGEPGTVSWTLSGTEPPRSFVFRWWDRRSRGANDRRRRVAQARGARHPRNGVGTA